MYINLITIDLCPGQGGGGVKPSGTLEISENGEYDVYSYASASVDVHPSTSLSETYISNGSYTITGEFNGGVITVDVPSSQFVTETLNVSANGTYNPGEGVDGYSQVVVDVPQSGWDQKSFTEEAITFTNIDNSASFVASSAFYQNKNIQTVNLPYATSVGNNAFDFCRSLTKVSLPMCSYIGSSAFQNCSLLTQVSLPVCSHIDTFAFRDCELLSQVSLPLCSLIDSYAFFWCSSLSQISLPVCSDIGIYAFCRCSLLSQVNLPMCSIIGDYAFNSCYSLSQVNLPMCSYIGNSAFYNTHLTILTLGSNSVVSLSGDNQFFPTDMLSIYVPGSLVDAYKSAPMWSYYSNRIFAIPS